MNKTHNIRRMEHYLIVKRNEVLIQATMWMNLEGIRTEISQKQYDKYCPLSNNCCGLGQYRGLRDLMSHVNSLQGRYSCAQLTDKKTEAERGLKKIP